MPALESYLLLFLIVTIINIIPYVMPPTWIVLAVLTAQFHIPVLPAVLIGVVAALNGRIVLALIARHFSGYFIHRPFFRNYKHLGTYLANHQQVTIPIILIFTLSPISSASLFIMAGLTQIRLRVLSLSFLIGRLVSYTFWVLSSHQVAKQFDRLFEHNHPRIDTALSILVSLAIIFIIGKINWMRILPLPKTKKRRKTRV